MGERCGANQARDWPRRPAWPLEWGPQLLQASPSRREGHSGHIRAMTDSASTWQGVLRQMAAAGGLLWQHRERCSPAFRPADSHRASPERVPLVKQGWPYHTHPHPLMRGTRGAPLPRDRGACPQVRGGKLPILRPVQRGGDGGARTQLHALHQGTRCASGNEGFYINQDLATLFWETTLKKYFLCINIYVKSH